MKNYFMYLGLIAALSVGFTACDDDDEETKDTQETFFYKAEGEGLEYLKYFDNVTDSTFTASDKSYVTQKLVVEAGMPAYIEVYDSNMEIVYPSKSGDSNYGHTYNYWSCKVNSLGKEYTLSFNFWNATYDINGTSEDMIWRYVNTDGNPFTDIRTSSEYYWYGWTNTLCGMGHRYFCATDDLNKGCGTKSDYASLYYAGLKENAKQCKYDTSEGFSDFYDDPDYPSDIAQTPITGLRLVTGGGGSQTITDPSTGIVWNKAVSVKGSDDMNKGAKGDFLYVYYTRDTRTGQKLYITHPLLNEKRGNLYKLDGASGIIFGTLGAFATWEADGRKDVDDDQLRQNLADQIVAGEGSKFSQSSREALAKLVAPGTSNRFEFVRLYDSNMKLVNNCPADFNRNARGSYSVYVSYSYITQEDAQWNNY